LLTPERILPALYEYEEAHIEFEDTLQKFLYHTEKSINYSKQMDVFSTRHNLCEVQRNILRLIQ